jgi:hypothetical protein
MTNRTATYLGLAIGLPLLIVQIALMIQAAL